MKPRAKNANSKANSKKAANTKARRPKNQWVNTTTEQEAANDDVLPRRRIGRYLVLALVLSSVIYSMRDVSFPMDLGWDINFDWVGYNKKIPVSNVKVEGELSYLSADEVKKIIIDMNDNDFVTLSLNELKKSLLKEPWLRSLTIKREWPSSLNIVLEEQQPIAIWGDTGFLNRYGEIVEITDLAQVKGLPVLWGDDDKAYSIADDYLMMTRLLNGEKLYMSSLKVTPDGNWTVELNQRFFVRLGDRDLSERVERFLYLYQQQLTHVDKELKSIDMRYHNGVAVSWKS